MRTAGQPALPCILQALLTARTTTQAVDGFTLLHSKGERHLKLVHVRQLLEELALAARGA